jgi:pilus assembly protein CpaF
MAVTDSIQRTNTNREAGWVNRLFNTESYTPEYQELKFTLHRKLLDRINLEALSSMAGERARSEIRVAVARLVDELMNFGRQGAVRTDRQKRIGIKL